MIKEKILNLVKGGFVHILFGNTLIKLISFISSIVIVRLVTKNEFAYFSYSNNLYSYINMFSALGLSTALLKFCSVSSSREERKAYFDFTIKFGSIFQLLLSLILCLIICIIDIPFPNAKKIIYLSIFIPTMTHVVTTVQMYNRSQLQNKRYTKMAVIQSVVTLFLSILFVNFFGIKGAIFAQYIAMFCTIFIGNEFVKKDLYKIKKINLSKQQLKPFFVMGISLMVANLFSVVMQYNEMFLVNNIIQSEVDTANYKVAMQIPSQLAIISGSIVVYFFPIIARMQNKKMIWEKAKKIGVLTFLIISIISIIGSLFAPYIIRFVYGDLYKDAITLTNIFWLVYAINAGFRMIPLNILVAIGNVKFNSIVSIISAIIHFSLSYYFITKMGIMGAAYAIGIVYFFSGIIYWYYLYKILRRGII